MGSGQGLPEDLCGVSPAAELRTHAITNVPTDPAQIVIELVPDGHAPHQVSGNFGNQQCCGHPPGQ